VNSGEWINSLSTIHAEQWRATGEEAREGNWPGSAGGSRCWSRWRCCRGGRLWWQTMVLLLLSSASLLLLPLFFICSVNNMLPSLRWSRAVQLVTAKRKNGAGADDSRRRRERRRRERLLFFSLLSVFFFIPCILFFSPFFSRQHQSHSLFPWFCWQLLPVLLVAVEKKKQWWCPRGWGRFFFFSV